MLRPILFVAAVGLALTAGAFPTRPVASAQTSRDPAASEEARHALANARLEARRARDRAAMLDRQARSSLIASDRATFAAAALAARVQLGEAALAGAEADLALIAEQRRVLDTRLARESAPVTGLLAGLQKQARRPPILQLLQPGSIAAAVHLRAAMIAIEPQIRGRTAALRQELARARALERESRRVAEQRRALQTDLAARRVELAALSAAERLRARRAAGSADREAERAFAVAQNASDLSTLVRRLGAADGRETPPARSIVVGPAPATADLTAPRRLPVQGRAAAIQASSQRGLTLEPRPGALVVAPGAGRVAFAGPYSGFGSIVILEHGAGWTSLVTGLAATRVVVGQSVIAGSPIGEAAASDPRLTVELRRNGTPVDPTRQLR